MPTQHRPAPAPQHPTRRRGRRCSTGCGRAARLPPATRLSPHTRVKADARQNQRTAGAPCMASCTARLLFLQPLCRMCRSRLMRTCELPLGKQAGEKRAFCQASAQAVHLSRCGSCTGACGAAWSLKTRCATSGTPLSFPRCAGGGRAGCPNNCEARCHKRLVCVQCTGPAGDDAAALGRGVCGCCAGQTWQNSVPESRPCGCSHTVKELRDAACTLLELAG